MAKVSPYIGRQKFNWKLRFICLVNALGYDAFDQAEDGTSNASFSTTRRAVRFTVRASRLRLGVMKTHVILYTNRGYYNFVVRNDRNEELSSKDNPDPLDYKDQYKRLERVIYANMSTDRSSTIMSRADDNYNWAIDHD